MKQANVPSVVSSQRTSPVMPLTHPFETSITGVDRRTFLESSCMLATLALTGCLSRAPSNPKEFFAKFPTTIPDVVAVRKFPCTEIDGVLVHIRQRHSGFSEKESNAALEIRLVQNRITAISKTLAKMINLNTYINEGLFGEVLRDYQASLQDVRTSKELPGKTPDERIGKFIKMLPGTEMEPDTVRVLTMLADSSLKIIPLLGKADMKTYEKHVSASAALHEFQTRSEFNKKNLELLAANPEAFNDKPEELNKIRENAVWLQQNASRVVDKNSTFWNENQKKVFDEREEMVISTIQDYRSRQEGFIAVGIIFGALHSFVQSAAKANLAVVEVTPAGVELSVG